ncbi:MAG: sugar transferase [Ignavibacteriaceae bacterium]|nr:sugar transferase [Ignavibacteriaceae bacterium]
MYKNFFKRLIDFTIAFFGILILSPLFAIITIVLYLSNNGKPIFSQIRPGLNEKEFKILKFRTMNEKRDQFGNLLPDNERITGIGNLIRKTSLDEIPQLFNVFIGQMSLIGPRPLLFRYIPLYNEKHRLRHLVKPGITGWAQVNGRNSISWNQKFDLDIYYVENLSFILDMKIFLLTIQNVIKKTGINQSNERPMVPFDGTN